MENTADPVQAPVLFLPHGGGPLPLLGDPSQHSLAEFLRAIGTRLGQPAALLVISAHWEQARPTLTAAARPELLYDYYGFPAESYAIEYPAPGAPALAEQIAALLTTAGFDAVLDAQRGFDHGLFVPLKLIYPQAKIPCLQLSLLKSLDASAHLKLGAALAPLRQRGVVILGSGMSFHNMRALMQPQHESGNEASDEFNDWLLETCCDPALDLEQRTQRLKYWESGPFARFCHPREEHLLPLHVCFGAATANGNNVAEAVFNETLWNKWLSGFLWD